MNAQHKHDKQRLIAAAQSGDPAAFNELVEPHQARLFNVAYRILGDEAAAADATQAALRSAYRALDEFQGRCFRTWLLRVLIHACCDQVRSRRRWPHRSADAHAAPAGDTMGDGWRHPPPAAIQRGLAMLSLDQRTAVVLADLQGLHFFDDARRILPPAHPRRC